MELDILAGWWQLFSRLVGVRKSLIEGGSQVGGAVSQVGGAEFCRLVERALIVRRLVELLRPFCRLVSRRLVERKLQVGGKLLRRRDVGAEMRRTAHSRSRSAL